MRGGAGGAVHLISPVVDISGDVNADGAPGAVGNSGGAPNTVGGTGGAGGAASGAIASSKRVRSHSRYVGPNSR